MNKKNWHQIMRGLSLITEVGLLIVVSGALGFGAGYLLDYFLNFDLVFKLIGLLVGLSAGFYTVYKLLISIFDD